MATEKNITMKQFNGTDYDTLYPKTIASQIPDVYSKTNTITTETLAQLGLTADKLPNDAFQQIKTLIDSIQASTDSKVRIQTGSYVGTGTYGARSPCSLTFDFEPKTVVIFGYSGHDGFMGLAVINTDMPDISSARYRYAYFYGGKTDGQESGLMPKDGTAKSLNGKTLSWYGGTEYFQCNISGNIYYYYALA